MNNPHFSKIFFCFPNRKLYFRNQNDFIKATVDILRKNGSIQYAGYLKDKDLSRDISSGVGAFNRDTYKSLSIQHKNLIRREIKNSVIRCYKKLSFPIKPIYIFIFPWFSNDRDKILLGGINAVAPYVTTLHLFVNPSSFSKESLRETIAHELNHLVFYYYHEASDYSILENMIIEGLAENFREQVFGGKSAPWSIAFSRIEAQKKFKLLKSVLSSKNKRLYKEIFFGSKKYKRWTGYSVGYWIVRDFLSKNPSIAWRDIMKLPISSICGKDFISSKKKRCERDDVS